MNILEIYNKLRNATSKDFKAIKINDRFECTFYEPADLGLETYYIMSETYRNKNAHACFCQEIKLYATDITTNTKCNATLVFSDNRDLSESSRYNFTLYIKDNNKFITMFTVTNIELIA